MTHPMLDFLNRCLNEDERIANTLIESSKGGVRQWLELTARSRDGDVETIRHLKVYQPEAALADIAAKRQVLELLNVAEQHLEKTRVSAPDYRLVQATEVARDALFKAAQYLAGAHATRAGYDPSWGPT